MPCVAAGLLAAGAGIGLAAWLRKRSKDKNKVTPRKDEDYIHRDSDASSDDYLPKSLSDALERARAERAESLASGNPAWFDLEVPVSRPPASTSYVPF